MKQPRLRRWAITGALAAALAGCGGSDDGTCSVRDQNSWLAFYMDAWYFWYALAPRPDPAAYASVQSFFDASLYAGGDPAFPPDRFSRGEPTASFERFYGDGETLGYGVAVNGVEAVADPALPLYVRYVEPLSDGAARGVVRGDIVVSVNGRPAADIVASGDFGALTPSREGETLQLVLRNAAGTERTVIVTARVFALTPVAGATVYTTQGGRKLAYLMVKDMIDQAQSGLDAAFASFRVQGVQDLVLDLRYNGGGLVSVGRNVASYVAGARAAGQTYAELLYNDKASGYNQRFTFRSPVDALALTRVFVLAGPRTCSASEQVVNGLRGVGVEVIAVGDVTCGKPVGSLPQDAGCGTTYSVVNFESVNALRQGRYFDGFAATCAVAEDWTTAQGATNDPLVMAAAYYADTGLCAPTAAGRAQPLTVRAKRRPAWLNEERSEMLPR
jgi:carboxyl-terminal processing protease